MQPILGIFLTIFRNLKDYIDILNECLDTTMFVTKLKNVLSLRRSGHFWRFWFILYYVSKTVGNHLTFSSELLRYTYTHIHTHAHPYTHTRTHTHACGFRYFLFLVMLQFIGLVS